MAARNNVLPGQEPARPPAGLHAAAALRQMLAGYWVSQSLYLAARIGVADLLEERPRSARELAPLTGVDAGALHRLLRALASVGVLDERGEGCFALTPLGEWLRTDVRGSLRGLAIWNGGLPFRAWADALYSLTTGKAALDRVVGRRLFAYLGEDRDAAVPFDEAMAGLAVHTAEAVLGAYDFSRIGVIADIGGGRGMLLAAILAAYPHMKGILFDRPAVLDAARSHLEAAGLAGRCELRAGDFFEAVPAGADAYLLASVLHDWHDDAGLEILRNCRRAVPRNGILLVVETVIPAGPGPSFSKLLDLQMMVVTGGLERSESECAVLLAAAGFRLVRAIPTGCPESVLEALPDWRTETK